MTSWLQHSPSLLSYRGGNILHPRCIPVVVVHRPLFTYGARVLGYSLYLWRENISESASARVA